MGLLRRVLAGIATGAGNHLIEKAKLDAQAARDQMLMNRELALKKLEHDYRVTEGDAALRRSKELTSHTAVEQRTTDKGRAEAEVKADEVKAKRTFDTAVKMLKIETGAKKELMRFEQSMKPAERDKVSRYVEGADGTYIGLTESGAQIQTGVKFVPHAQRSTSSDEGGDSVDSFRPGGGKPTGVAPAPAQPTSTGVKPGTIIVDDKTGKRLKLSAAGKWEPM